MNGYQADAFVPGARGVDFYRKLRGAQLAVCRLGNDFLLKGQKQPLHYPKRRPNKRHPCPVCEEPQDPGGRYDDPGSYYGGVLPPALGKQFRLFRATGREEIIGSCPLFS